MNRRPFPQKPSGNVQEGAQALPWASPIMRSLEKDLACAIRFDSNVMLSGERGAGKKFVAQAIHQRSRRQSKPFVIVRCQDCTQSLTASGSGAAAALPFTHTLSTLETHGTLVIDEIQESSESLQRQLLQFIENEMISGSDLRLMTTTTTNLCECVRSNQFRSDLFYRLNIIHLMVPALRDRPEDIPILFHHSLSRYAKGHPARLSAAAWQWLVAYPWPGNVAELNAAAETLAVLDLPRPLEVDDLPSHIRAFSDTSTN